MKKTILIALTLFVMVMTACNKVENITNSGSKLIIVGIMGKDLKDTDSTTAFSDVITKGSIFNDNAKIMLMAQPLDPLVDEPSYYYNILVDQVDIEYTRNDGQSVQGVHVPYAYSQKVSWLVEAGKTSTSFACVVIRHAAKMESPLVELRAGDKNTVLQLTAKITLHGTDSAGKRVTPVVGYLTIWCADFADPTDEE